MEGVKVMCGIAGWMGSMMNSEEHALKLGRFLSHRGPDAQGIQVWPDVTFVHTRLSVIDLSPAGKQPISNENGMVWSIFNGEIYNHQELRESLEARGHKFLGRSDAEIFPHLYEEFGLCFLEHLRGMFAIAIYDVRARRLTLARDRFGIKPLFYAPGNKRLVFASEIRALRQMPGVDDRIDVQALSDFTALLYIPAPETFFLGIRALQPGEILEAYFDEHEIKWETSFFYKWTISPDPTLSLGKAIDQANGLLDAATSRQLESDVPLGSLLSGGIDSSLISAAAQKVLGDRLRTFNVQFPDELYDETWAALAVAKHIGSNHQVLKMESGVGTWEQIIALLQHVGQPFADTSIFAANAVCQLMRKQVTVALSGDGGDEGFGGYNFYWQLERILSFQQIPSLFWKTFATFLFPLVHLGVMQRSFPHRMKFLADADDIAVIQSLFCWLSEEEHRSLIRDKRLLPVRRFFMPQWDHRLPSNSTRLEKISALATEVNVRLTLPNDFLFKVDMASMKEGLEIRVPMLDEELFAFGLSLPHSLKIEGRNCKKVLRGVAKRRLPFNVAQKPKMGFSIPIDKWVDSHFKVQLKEVLLSSASSLPEFLNPEVYVPMVEAFCGDRGLGNISRQGLYQRIIMLLALHLALDQNIH